MGSFRLRPALAGLALLLASPTFAQTAPSDSAMVNLVRMLVEQGVLSRAKGDALMAQARAEATQAAALKAGEAPPTALATAAPPAAPGTIRVTHVPETVRAQIKEELKAEVLAQAKAEGWAAPGKEAPDWVSRIRVSGDLRIRSQSDLYSRTNSDQIFDFAAINELGPYDVINSPVIPFLNSRQNRTELQLRARLNVDAQISDQVQVGLQIATGDDRSPISTNDTLGGGLRPREIWLQEAHVDLRPTDWSLVQVGRFRNPFISTELLFDEDLSFDGGAVRLDVGKALDSGIGVSLRGGAFPLEFGDGDYPTFDQAKRSYPAKWLFSGQIAFDARVADKVDVQLAAAYHSFTNIQGDLSEPCLLYLGAAECSTDARRPFYQRKGNTLSPLRQIAADPTLQPGEIQSQPQFFGLTFDYDVLDISARASFPVSDRVGVTVLGNYLNNLAFRREDICRNGVLGQPFNNGGSDGDGNICSETDPTSFVGGNQGYLVGLSIGTPQILRWGDWNVGVSYRYLESDAVLDSLSDSDFHLGGTNSKGFVLSGRTGLYKGVTLGARYLSGNEISGEPLSIDVLQIDLGVSF